MWFGGGIRNAEGGVEQEGGELPCFDLTPLLFPLALDGFSCRSFAG